MDKAMWQFIGDALLINDGIVCERELIQSILNDTKVYAVPSFVCKVRAYANAWRYAMTVHTRTVTQAFIATIDSLVKGDVIYIDDTSLDRYALIKAQNTNMTVLRAVKLYTAISNSKCSEATALLFADRELALSGMDIFDLHEVGDKVQEVEQFMLRRVNSAEASTQL